MGVRIRVMEKTADWVLVQFDGGVQVYIDTSSDFDLGEFAKLQQGRVYDMELTEITEGG